ncbi:uncharacterized protein LOC110430046 [Sorghum bicolor]|uniref:uncharacterized protein LOC110430046 n=1 Tax=Sorghum bicolor TaxID=4558 RepID=UPI000B423AC0|nr:uncharacterized protein LOC110430046 [Sorghum bicolor]|eukprot:XP_021302578.1 uncharacterized protein LOC110430046 [Sorghum bicolor]
MPRRGKSSKPSYGRTTGSPYINKPLPSGVPVPMWFCGDPCKVDISEDEETYRQRYWMCSNYAWEPTPKQCRSNFITPPQLCDFEQWIDTKIKESDKRLLQGLKEWDAERGEILEKRRGEEAQKREHKEEEVSLSMLLLKVSLGTSVWTYNFCDLELPGGLMFTSTDPPVAI